jgi:hypothetical protein
VAGRKKFAVSSERLSGLGDVLAGVVAYVARREVGGRRGVKLGPTGRADEEI